jgi:tetratricopeptide (TPR) repeat protein
VPRRSLSPHARAALALLSLTLTGACDRDSDLLAAHLAQADKALAEGRPAESLTAYRHAYELSPHDARVQRGTMRARVAIMAEMPGRIGAESLDDLRYEAQLLLAQDKGREAVCLTALANVLARRGDLDGARLKLAEALRADPALAAAHVARGTLLAGSKETRGEARVELELALKGKPDSGPALAALGQLKLGEGEYAAAVEKLEAALRQGEDVSVRLALGNARLQQQRPAEAAEHLRRAVELEPKNADALSLLGQALLGAGQLEDAERALRAAAQLRPDEPTQTALGFALLRQKKAEQALALFRQLLAQDGGLATARYGAAAANDELGRAGEALAEYKKLLAMPTEGRQKSLLGDLRPEAERRVQALTAALSAGAPGADAGAPPAPGKPRP